MAFQRLSGNIVRQVRSRFDYWIDGGIEPRYFHGWPNNLKYKDCWVFKWKESRRCHRLYGFLCHPRRLSNPRFQLCVLVSHATKNEWETDPTELDDANLLRADVLVIAAIEKAFPDTKGSTNQWLN